MTGNAPGTNAQDTYEFTNTNKWDPRQLVTMALMCAIGVLLSFVEFPLLPGVTWLKYDASAMPAMVCGFAFGAGVERIAALRYDLPDLRTLVTGDMRFLNQF